MILPCSCSPTPRALRTPSPSRCATQRRRTMRCRSVEQLRAATSSSARSSAKIPTGARVLAAIGTTAADFEPDRIDVAFNGVQVCRDGSIGDPRELVDLSGHDVHVEVDLRNGRHSATIWTNDLTYDYVKENAEYST